MTGNFIKIVYLLSQTDKPYTAKNYKPDDNVYNNQSLLFNTHSEEIEKVWSEFLQSLHTSSITFKLIIYGRNLVRVW